MKCYNCHKQEEYKNENITFKDDLEVFMCNKCVKSYREE